MTEHPEQPTEPLAPEFPHVIIDAKVKKVEVITAKTGRQFNKVKAVHIDSDTDFTLIMPLEPAPVKGSHVPIRLSLLDKEDHAGFGVLVDDSGAEIRVPKPQEQKAA